MNEKRPDLAVTLCRRGLELDPGHDSQSLHQLLIQTLADAGRREEARAALADLYFPEPEVPLNEDPAAAPALGFRPAAAAGPRTTARNGRPAWLNATATYGDGNVTLPGLDLLDPARRLGLLPDLLATGEQRLARLTAAIAAEAGGAEDRRRAAAGLRALVTLLRIDVRDPRAEEDLPAVLAPGRGTPAGLQTGGASVYHDHGEIALRMTLARRLRAWPGHEALALEALRVARRMADESRQSFTGSYRVNLLARQAALELQLGSPDVAAANLREWARGLEPSPATGNRLNVFEAETCLRLMLRLPGSDADFVHLLARARKTEEGRRLAYNYDLERAAREGNAARYQPLAWLLDEGAGPPGAPEATLGWEIRPEHPYDRTGEARFLLSRGRSITGSERERTLVFAGGPDPGNLTPTGRLTTRETFGTWTGPVPAGVSYLKVTLEGQPDAPPGPAEESPGRGDASDIPKPRPVAADQPPGYWMRLVRAPNLVQNPGLDGLATRAASGDTFALPGWPGLPAGFWRTAAEGGPRPGRPFVQCEVDRERNGRGNNDWLEAAAAPIPLEPGREYFQSAWVRDAGPNAHIVLARRYLDKDGRVLRTVEAPNYATLTWRRLSQRLTPGAGGDGAADPIPPGAVSVVPFLKFQGAVEWTGMYLGALRP